MANIYQRRYNAMSDSQIERLLSQSGGRGSYFSRLGGTEKKFLTQRVEQYLRNKGIKDNIEVSGKYGIIAKQGKFFGKPIGEANIRRVSDVSQLGGVSRSEQRKEAKLVPRTAIEQAVQTAQRTGQNQLVRQNGQVYTVKKDGSFEARGKTIGETFQSKIMIPKVRNNNIKTSALSKQLSTIKITPLKSQLEKASDYIRERDRKLIENNATRQERLRQARESRKELIRRTPKQYRAILTGLDIGIRSGEIGFLATKSLTSDFGQRISQALLKSGFLLRAGVENVKKGQGKKFLKEIKSGPATTSAMSSLALAKRNKRTGKIEANVEGIVNIGSALVLATLPNLRVNPVKAQERAYATLKLVDRLALGLPKGKRASFRGGKTVTKQVDPTTRIQVRKIRGKDVNRIDIKVLKKQANNKNYVKVSDRTIAVTKGNAISLKGGIGKKPASLQNRPLFKSNKGSGKDIVTIRTDKGFSVIQGNNRFTIAKPNKISNVLKKLDKQVSNRKSIQVGNNQIQVTKKLQSDIKALSKLTSKIKRGQTLTKSESKNFIDINRNNQIKQILDSRNKQIASQSQGPQIGVRGVRSGKREVLRQQILTRLKRSSRKSKLKSSVDSSTKGSIKSDSILKSKVASRSRSKKRSKLKSSVKKEGKQKKATASRDLNKVKSMRVYKQKNAVSTSQKGRVKISPVAIFSSSTSSVTKSNIVQGNKPDTVNKRKNTIVSVSRNTINTKKGIKAPSNNIPTRIQNIKNTPKTAKLPAKTSKRKVPSKKITTRKIKARVIPEIPDLPKSKKSSKKISPAYVGVVKVGKKFVRVTDKLTKNRAIKRTARVVDKTVARSLGIQRKGNIPFSLDIKRPNILTKFRKSKSLRNVLVEKSKYAIDSRGEKQGITVRGYLAKRNKQNKAKYKANKKGNLKRGKSTSRGNKSMWGSIFKL